MPSGKALICPVFVAGSNNISTSIPSSLNFHLAARVGHGGSVANELRHVTGGGFLTGDAIFA